MIDVRVNLAILAAALAAFVGSMGAASSQTAGASGEVLASSEGPNGMVFQIASLKRGEGALTLQGRLVNEGSAMYSAINKLVDPAIERRDARYNPNSASGIYVVDQAAGKRAGPLFTEAGDCICSTDVGFLKPGETHPIFAKFPLPEGNVDTLDVILPNFLPAEAVPIGNGS